MVEADFAAYRRAAHPDAPATRKPAQTGDGNHGSGILLGVRPAPFFMQEPDLYQSIYDKKNVKEWKAAQKFRERQRVLHGQ